MLLHAYRAAKHVRHKIMIRAVDPDVVIMGISVALRIHPEDELWNVDSIWSWKESAVPGSPPNGRWPWTSEGKSTPGQ